MTLLRRRNTEGRWCACSDENNLNVTRVDGMGFVTAVKCTHYVTDEGGRKELETTCHDENWVFEKISNLKVLKRGDHICWHRPILSGTTL